MKKILICLLAAAMLLSLATCGSTPQEPEATPEPTEEATPEPTPAPTPTPEPTPDPTPSIVTQTDYVNIEGIYVNSSYRDKDNSPLRMVYLFYTAATSGENLSVGSTQMNMTINDVNTYTSELYPQYPSVCAYMNSYYYSNYLTDVYVGDSVKIVETFKIPEGDLTEGKTIRLSKNRIPNMEEISMSTDDIIFCDGIEDIAQQADPEGYEYELWKQTDADADTVARVKAQINGYQWEFYVNTIYYELEFWDNSFELRVKSLGTVNPGSYSVKNGYVCVTSDSNGVTVAIPYTFDNSGEIDLDVITAYDVKVG